MELDVDEVTHAWRAWAAELLRSGRTAMGDARATVLALGYQPEQCSIVEVSDGRSEKRTLKVLGVPCFEVTIEARTGPPPDRRLEIVTTPRLIAWPPARPAVGELNSTDLARGATVGACLSSTTTSWRRPAT